MSAPQSPSVAKQALLALDKLQSKLDAYERAAKEPIAIVGVGLRFPGGAHDADSYWRILDNGVDAITEVPEDRWDADAFYAEDAEAPGKINTRWGGFLERIDGFDPTLFGLSPREIRAMDPQHRLLLEIAWEAFEDAGQPIDRLAGSKTGVFVGITTNDYLQLQARFTEPATADAYAHHGSVLNAAAGRISYIFGLHGPSLAVDTACSSSLTAIHLACQSLRLQECAMALAGGVNLLISPFTSVRLSKGKMLAADGRCKTFDASADGYVRAEGCGLVVLKRLSDAQRAGDHVLAVILGSAVNQDGRSSGLTVPNGLAQTALIREAIERAGIRSDQVDYVEAHGTGTSLGDPIEIDAIAAALDRPADRPVLVGSCKTNIGHLESASGIAGLIKVALSLQRGVVPASLHFHTPNPYVDWPALPVRVASSRTAWPSSQSPRVAGVSAFGASGTNVHVILQEAPALTPRPSLPDRPAHLLVLSAATDDALRALAVSHARHLSDATDSVGDICFTAATGRVHQPHRVAAVAADARGLGEQLSQFGQHGESACISGVVRDRQKPRLVFLFGGHGSQFAGMARQLYETQAAFRAAIDACSARADVEMDRPLLSVLFPAGGDESLIDRTEYTQPALFAVQYAMATLLRSWGLEPDAVLGHSVGDIAAAAVAGVIDAGDGMKLAAARGRLVMELASPGAMAAVFSSMDNIEPHLAHYRDVQVAAVNGPRQIVLSGPRQVLEDAVAALRGDGIRCEWLPVSHAFHSKLMDPVSDALDRIAGTIPHSAPAVLIGSNVTGVVSKETRDAGYWRRHLRQPVQFAAATRALYDAGCRWFVECGPGASLCSLGQTNVTDAEVVWTPTLRRGRPDWTQLLEAIGALHVTGLSPDWRAFERDHERRTVRIPTYPFQRERFWIDGLHSGALSASAGHEVGVTENVYEIVWRDVGATKDARVQGTWLIVSTHHAPADVIAAAIAAAGGRGIVVSPRDSALENALEEFSKGQAALEGAIFIPDAGAPAVDESSAAAVARRAVQDCAELATTIKSISSRRWGSQPRVVVVTSGAQSVLDTDRVSPPRAAIWGLGRSVSLEHPDVWGGLIDVPYRETHLTPADAAAVVAELAAGDHEDQVALRNGRRLAARLVARQRSVSSAAHQFKGTYLITGGLGALGLLVAQWLASRGARRVVLAGRRPPAESTRAILDAMSARGCETRPIAVDVADEAAMGALIDELAAGDPPLRGVIHAAGVFEAASVEQLTAAQLAAVMRAKVSGGWLLHTLTRTMPLEFFVSFSSASAVWGWDRHSHYGAANHVLDALAALRQAEGLPANSISWGPWEAGMGSEDDRQALSRLGVRVLSTDAALSALARVIGSDSSHTVVADVEWATFAPLYSLRKRRPFLAELEPRESQPPALLEQREPELRRVLEAEAAALRPQRVLEHVRGEATAVLGRRGGPPIDAHQGFRELGMDSLMSVELSRRLQRSIGAPLPSTIAFDYPNIASIARYLCVSVLGIGDGSASVSGDQRDGAIDEMVRLTDAEAEALLLHELGKGRG